MVALTHIYLHIIIIVVIIIISSTIFIISPNFQFLRTQLLGFVVGGGSVSGGGPFPSVDRRKQMQVKKYVIKCATDISLKNKKVIGVEYFESFVWAFELCKGLELF